MASFGLAFHTKPASWITAQIKKTITWWNEGFRRFCSLYDLHGKSAHGAGN
jgi:hypothetical protein